MTQPNFCLIGAAKSGTTSLYEYLKQHPQIFMSPVKEPRYFGLVGETPDFRGPGDAETNRQLVTQTAAYRALFAGVTDEIAIGEASPWYLYLEKAPIQIQQQLPQLKLIVILRHPVERAYSNFLHQVRYRTEPLPTFALALAAEPTRQQNHWRPFWFYKQLGFYHAQLSRYYQRFPREQIRVYLYEDLCDRPNVLFEDLFRFLSVDERFLPNLSEQHNVTYFLAIPGCDRCGCGPISSRVGSRNCFPRPYSAPSNKPSSPSIAALNPA
ncbi:MAG: sulfotransferase [Chloroflexaceae bacterium]|nr:sulfotransferase [Chloroflexaceae bacterium]